MIRNYLTTALRNLTRNKLVAAINVIGLAVGFAAALLVARARPVNALRYE